jgi:hypothetical protein
MWHTLEHLPDPLGAIERSAGLLRAGGHLIVSVPNLSSVQSRLGGDRWFHLDLPRHLYHFTPTSLCRLMERAGFVVERVDYFYPEIEIAGLLQTILNRMGFDQDVMYRFIKRDATARDRGGLALSFAVAAALLPAAVAWSLIAPVARTGGSIQVLARVGNQGRSPILT